jgi:hypothetical protein
MKTVTREQTPRAGFSRFWAARGSISGRHPLFKATQGGNADVRHTIDQIEGIATVDSDSWWPATGLDAAVNTMGQIKRCLI